MSSGSCVERMPWKCVKRSPTDSATSVKRKLAGGGPASAAEAVSPPRSAPMRDPGGAADRAGAARPAGGDATPERSSERVISAFAPASRPGL